MTVPLRQVRPRVMFAAAEEADRSSAAEIGVDHVLVGLLLSGGPAADALAAAGLDAAGVRRSVDALRAETLLGFGVQAPSPARRPLEAHAAGETLLPSHRVRQILERAAERRGDGEAALLRELTAEPDSDARRIFEHCDVDVDKVIVHLERGHSKKTTPAPVGLRQSRATAFIPAQDAAIRAMIVDPGQRVLWDSSVVDVEHAANGAIILLKGSTRQSHELTLRPAASVNEVVWTEAATGPNTGSTDYTATLAPAGKGTHVTLTSTMNLPKPWMWIFIASAARTTLRRRLQGLAAALNEHT